MSVYVDDAGIRADVPNGGHVVHGVWCHMTADTRAELDAMADRIGLRRSWIQHPGTWKEHYDLTRSKRCAAVAAGAIEVDGLDHIRTFLIPRRDSMRLAQVPVPHMDKATATTGAEGER